MGSEMCIRDRYKQVEWADTSSAVLDTADILLTVQPLTLAQIGACLLYTSDAADERSSVDLGGRRIIKKKKRRAKRGGGERGQWTIEERCVLNISNRRSKRGGRCSE